MSFFPEIPETLHSLSFFFATLASQSFHKMESFLEDLKNQVQCLLCNETMYEPKLLQCFHTFCKNCIKSNTQLDGQVNVFKCPHCTSQTVLEQLENVEDLQTSSIHSRILKVLSLVENQKVCSVEVSHCEALWRCLDCDCSLCDECLSWHARFAQNHKIVSLSSMTKEDIETMIKREQSCKTHTSKDVEWCCQDCDALICLLCLEDHIYEHDLLSLQEFIVIEKVDLIKNLVEEIERVTNNEEDKKKQEKIAVDIRDHGQKAKEHVKKVTKNLVKTLLDQEQQLLAEIQESITRAERNLRILNHTSAAQEYVKYFAGNATASEMMENRNNMCSQKFSYEPFQQDVGGIHFEPNDELYDQVKAGQGQVTLFKKADAKSCSVKVEPDVEAMETTILTVEMKTAQGKAADESLDNLTIKVTPEEDVEIGEKRMTINGEATFEVIFHVPGQFTAHVEVRGNPVSNSPLVMGIEPQNIPIEDLELAKDFNIGSNSYRGIAVNTTDDRIAVADTSSHCVRVFNMEGDLLLKFGSEGSGQKQYKYPEGLAFLGETDLVIADFGNHRICILDTAKGKTIKTLGCQGSGYGQFMEPRGVCVDDASNIFVCDYGNHRIQVFTEDGEYNLYQFRLQDDGKPYDIITHKGLFYVSCLGSSPGVYVIEMKNERLSDTIITIGCKDCNVAQLNEENEPRGLSIDSDNNLLVCIDNMICKFTLAGQYIGKTNEQSNTFYYIAALTDDLAICSTRDAGLFAISTNDTDIDQLIEHFMKY